MKLLIARKIPSSMEKHFYKLLIILALFAGNIAKAKAQSEVAINDKDSMALVDLYNYTNGDNWTNNTRWLKEPVSKWFGIKTNANRVTAIRLNGNNLSGTIPASIGNLTEITELALADNHLTKAIPESIGNLVKLNDLKLYSNEGIF